MAKSVAKERQINFYPSPALKEKIHNYAKNNNMPVSAAVKEALQHFFTSKGKTDRQ